MAEKQLIEEITDLFVRLASDPLGLTEPWIVGASAGKPYLRAGRRGTIAHGTIATWDEFRLIAAVINALPMIIAHWRISEQAGDASVLVHTLTLIAERCEELAADAVAGKLEEGELLAALEETAKRARRAILTPEAPERTGGN